MLLNVQGGFKHNAKAKKLKYHDITTSCSLVWNVQPPAPLTNLTAVCSTPTLVTSGEFVGATDGCACLDAQVGNLVSNVVAVAVGAGTCSPDFCATPTGTPTP